LFLARELELHSNGPKLDAGEHIEIEWVTLSSLVDALRAGRLPDVKTQIGVMHLQRIVEGDWDWPEVLVTR
jgi:ADP-ribose pyrophosphatase